MRVITAHNGNLLREMVVADFKLRYQGSLLGYLWSFVRPLALFGVLYVVFVRFLKIGGSLPHYAIYLLLGIVLWNFFLESTNVGLRSIVDKGDLIRKVSIPKYIVIVAPAASAFVNLLLNLIVVFIFALASHVQFHQTLLLLPMLLIELFTVSIAISFLLSALYVKFRDVAYIWEVMAQVLFYATPIIYPLTSVPTRVGKILVLSPIAQVIQDARYALLDVPEQAASNVLPHFYIIVPYVLVILLIGVSILYFRSSSKYFAENI